MIDLLKKTVLTGVGIAFLTKDKIEELGRDLVKKSQLTEKEGEKFVGELLAKAEESKVQVNKQLETMIQKTLDKMQLAKASDIEKLEVEIRNLQVELAKMQAQVKQKTTP